MLLAIMTLASFSTMRYQAPAGRRSIALCAVLLAGFVMAPVAGSWAQSTTPPAGQSTTPAPAKKSPTAISNQVVKKPPAAAPAGVPRINLAGAVMSPHQAKSFQTALTAADAARWDDAMEAARATGQPVAAKYVTWLALRDINNDASFGTIAAFMASNPNWPDAVTLRRRAEERCKRGRLAG